MKPERIQKVLAQAGVGSRRQIESWVREGRLRVDGKTATLGQPVVLKQNFSLDGKPLRLRADKTVQTRVLIFNKPEGVICSNSDPGGRPTVFEHLPRGKRERWILVGRLDLNSSGLLLVTNNGELANRLMHPSSEVEREYAVRVFGEASRDDLRQLQEGIELEDGPASFKSIRESGGSGQNHWYKVVLSEGRNREVRRMWEALGYPVSRLIRVRYGPIHLPHIPQGQWKDLKPKEVALLTRLVKLQDEAEEQSGRGRHAGRKQSRDKKPRPSQNPRTPARSKKKQTRRR
jgi:23S rRNA pseudouridine2605 synthase